MIIYFFTDNEEDIERVKNVIYEFRQQGEIPTESNAILVYKFGNGFRCNLAKIHFNDSSSDWDINEITNKFKSLSRTGNYHLWLLPKSVYLFDYSWADELPEAEVLGIY
jgi:hypothetical protein